MRAADEGAGGTVGLGGYAAGIYDHYVGDGGVALVDSRGAQTIAHSLAVGAGRSASEVFDVKLRHASSLLPVAVSPAGVCGTYNLGTRKNTMNMTLKWVQIVWGCTISKRSLPALLLAIVTAVPLCAAAQPRILVYTRNYTPDGKGYVHDNIASSVEAIKKMGAEKSFAVDVTDDPAVFTDTNLKQYAAIVFSNSNNQAFSSDTQRDAFKHYIESGGGFVGIHSAAGSERDWPWFWSMLGGKFAAHPKMQTFTVQVVDPQFPAAKGLPGALRGRMNATSTII